MTLLALRAILNQQGASWSPLDLPDVAHWWDASNAASFTFSSGTSVSAWADLIGSADFAQATSAAQPSRSGTQNGLDTVVFDGAGDYMDTGAVTIAQPFSFLVAGKITAAYSGFFSGADGSPDGPQMWAQNGPLWTYAGSLGVTALTIQNVAASMVATFDGASSGAWVNGTSAGTLNVGTLGVSMFRLAERTLHSSYWLAGSLWEMAVTTSEIDADNRALWDDYVTAKWAP